MEAQKQTPNKEKVINIKFIDSKYATGRRKKSVARVWLQKGTGNIYINGKKMVDYLKEQRLQMIVSKPLELIKKEKDFDIKATVKGGGMSGQAGAILHAISRALVEFDSSLKSSLKKEKLTTRDSRTVERKKYGHRKARRSFQFSKR
jgi:small subunit ribosomal protein S9